MIFTLQDLHHGLPGEVVETGRSLLQLGQVSASNILRNGELVTGVIEQTNGRPLRVYARIQQAEGRITILGECSCEARENCAHVAATLLHALGDVPSLAAGTRHLAPTAQEAPSAERPNQRLLYRLIPQGDELLVETCVGRPLGEMSHEICGRFEPAQGQLATPARFLEAIDLELLPALDRSPRGTGSPLPTGGLT